MTHVIRIRDSTFEELIRHSKWSDTMDTIISGILRQVRLTANDSRPKGEDDKQ
jgi:hypothetical protein